jgi:hypothetical protein
MGKSDMVESVREVNEAGAAQRDLEKEKGVREVNMHDRVDSATSGMLAREFLLFQPSFHVDPAPPTFFSF